MNLTDFFNKAAENWDENVFHDINKINQIMSFIDIKKGRSILDVGTGTGVLIPFLHSCIGETGRIVVADLAQNMIDIAKSKYYYKNTKFIVSDVLSEDFPYKQFDNIICYSMFPHFIDKRKAILTLANYLNKGGKLVICHSQSRDTINNFHKNKVDLDKDTMLPSIQYFRNMFDECGLGTITEIDNDEMFVVIGVRY
ncbi:MAG: hypothetical protein A2Y15_05315 [Clostridiales bacterium GWF2_36_10]|nr:MAG: hypothetical protein A2Y15_05315 [Clostridiales bacterium GWF2_36_10]HAN20083.1 class I SAM-dependent methyltransferase [Clostridiales bacterium]